MSSEETKADSEEQQKHPLIDKHLSIITKAGARYEGTLVDVDKVKKTMSLKQVKNMGTEGRRGGENELPPTDNILGMVKFRVELIQSFNIVPEEEEQEDEEDQEELDPAIIECETE